MKKNTLIFLKKLIYNTSPATFPLSPILLSEMSGKWMRDTFIG